MRMAGAWLLDTDHCIAYLSARSPVHTKVVARINAIPASDLYVSTFSALELAEGPFHAQSIPSQHAQQTALDAV
jgi:predicted nucleic acid-binding protein